GFDAARWLAAADIAIYQADRWIAFKILPVALAEYLDGGVVERELARRQHTDGIELAGGALAVRIETANAVDFVIEQIDAIGRVRRHGEQVENGAAQREFAVCVHLRHGGVTRRFQSRTKGQWFEPVAATENKRARVDELRRWQ